MNSLNIISSRVIGQSTTPGPRRSRSRSQGDIFVSSQIEDCSRGRSVSAKGLDAVRRLLGPTEKKTDAGSEAPGPDGKDDDDDGFFNEKTPLLAKASTSHVSSYQRKLQNLMKKIAAAFTALLSAIGAPVVYVITRFKDEDGRYSPLLPMKMVRPLFRRRKGTASTAAATAAVGLSIPTNDKASRAQRGQGKRAESTLRLPSKASSESLTSNTSESEAEKKNTRPRSADVRQSKSKVDDDVNARRSIRIREYRTESFDMRKHKRKSVIGEEPLTLNTIKSPMSASQSLKIHKYPHAPAPPRPLIPRRQPSYSNLIPRAPNTRPLRYQKTLVLDLDETLIHSLAKGGRMSSGHMVEVRLNTAIGLNASPNAPVIGPNHPILYYVHKRPHCDEFLRKVCQWYKLVVFTASVQEYADPVIDWLEQERKFFQGRYYRQHCTFRNGAYIKDLSSIEPDLSRVAILDNSPMSYIFHEDNAIPIEGWLNDPTDNDLLHLIPLLEALQYVTDVRALLALRRGEAEV